MPTTSRPRHHFPDQWPSEHCLGVVTPYGKLSNEAALMIMASSPETANEGGDREAAAGTAASSRSGREEGEEASPSEEHPGGESRPSDDSKDTQSQVYNPESQRVTHLSRQIQRRVKLLSRFPRSRETQAASEAPSLAGLHITGLSVRARHTWRHCPKEDSERRARRYLVEVDEHLSTRHRRKEAPRPPRPAAITRNNQITPARTPVAAQRDHSGKHSQSHTVGRCDTQPRPPHHPRVSSYNSCSGTKVQEKGSAAALCGVLLIQNSRLCVQRVPRHSRSAPPQPQPTPQVPLAITPPPPQTRLPTPDQPLDPFPVHPGTLFTVTVRTTPTHQHLTRPLLQNPGEEQFASHPPTGSQQEPSRPASSAHVSVRRDNPLIPPPSATCLPASPRSLQSLAGRSYNHSHQLHDAHRWYITPRVPLTTQLHTQPRTGYTCSPGPRGLLPEPSLVKVDSRAVLGRSDKPAVSVATHH
ncbi:hypothetical protein Hamer_G018611 [Homarus americanus]|uniref:Uncharacterized protein n=1 Tax=Homarus americanus TaxID=6706 RepID=A0A8J5N1H9_HOMAM|nr:hypothetical protein Hamer_G018611 [Homarus americanus]